MNIFLDAVSNESNIIVFDEKRNIIKSHSFNSLLNESTLLLKEFDLFLKNIWKTYFQIENIVVVNWPWSFTWIRTIVIFVNTINFVIKKRITPISFFDLFDKYPIVKKSSKKDLFIKKDENMEVKIISNDELMYFLEQNNIKNIYWDIDFEIENINLIKKPNYKKVIKNIIFKNYSLIEPYYIKKPSIT